MKLTTLFAYAGLTKAANDVKVVSCTNADTGRIEMTIHIERATFDVRPAELTDFDDTYYQGVWTFEELDAPVFNDISKIVDFNKRFFVDKKTHTDDSGAVINMWPSVERTLMCRFSTADQDLTTNRAPFTVMGVNFHADIVADASMQGQLEYKIKVETPNPMVGKKMVFVVEPATPGIVHARVKWCNIKHKANGESIRVFGADDAWCRNAFIDFEIVSGFASKETQRFQYDAFRWSTAINTSPINEEQLINCYIELQHAAFDVVSTDVCINN